MRRVRRLQIQHFSHEELTKFKTKYHVSSCAGKRLPPDDNLSLDEKFKKMALASRSKFYLNNKQMAYN